ncbi:MAG: response regulator [Candidatus Hodarchaeales archaeon]|jgi:DNA-binding NtrC family response regulator
MGVHSTNKLAIDEKIYKKKKIKSQIIIVDDDEDFLLALKFLLTIKHLGYECKTFNDVQFAIDYINKSEKRKTVLGGSIALIISDYNMYPKNGLEFFREIWRMKLKIPFILMSGFLSENIIKEAQNIGIVNCLRKNDEISDSIVRISNQLKTGR